MSQIPIIIYRELKNEFIDRRLDTKEEESEYLLNRILEYKLSDCYGSFTSTHFFHYLYEPSVFSKYYQELNDKVKSDLRYHFVHSYAKNGKSTFVKYFCHSHNKKGTSFKCVFFDLGETSQSSNQPIDNRVKEFLKGKYLSFLGQDKFKFLNDENPIINFFKYLSNPNNKDKNVYSDSRIISALDTLKNIIGKKMLQRYYSSEDSEQDYSSFDYSKFVTELWEFNFSTNELFSFLVTIKSYYYAKNSKSNKVLYTFDNLDDIQSYLPEDVSLSYVSELIHFQDYVSKLYPRIYMCEDGKYLDIDFVFVYRTSNFLSTIYKSVHIKGTQLSRVREHLLDINKFATKVMITSVKHSDKIITKRIQFYTLLCKKYGLPISKKVSLLENVLHSFEIIDKQYFERKHSDKVDNIDIDKFLRFWNGNKGEFYQFLFSSNFKQSELEILKSKEMPDLMSNLSMGLIIHKVLKYFKNHKNASYTTYNEFLNFTTQSFDDDVDKSRCSLARLFFTYLFHSRPIGLKNETINDVYNYGTSLKSFLEDLQNLTKGTVYNSSDFKDLFSTLNKFEFDNWGKFISSCSSTYVKDVPDNEANKSKTGDIEPKYVREIAELLGENKIQEFNKVRFYLNDAGLYFMFKMKRNFEYFSFCSNSANNALSDSINFIILQDNSKNETYSIILEKVYERIELCTEITLVFLENSIDMTAIDLCNSKWSFRGKMFFDDLISKVISYIEDVRYSALQDFIKINCADEHLAICKKDINEKFTLNIEKYLNLFDSYYYRLNNDLPRTLKATKKQFDILREKVNEIKEDFEEWNIRIKGV